MNKTGHIKDTKIDNNDFRQYVINCIGANDQRNYFSLAPFGFDSIAAENTRTLTLETQNKDVKFSAGVLNKIKINDLKVGESVIFSTSGNGNDLKAYIRLNNDGTMNLNGGSDNLVGFIELKNQFDELNNKYNKLIKTMLAWIPAAGDGGTALKTALIAADPLNSTANIDLIKKDNLKIE